MLSTLVILGVATFVMVTAVVHQPEPSGSGLFGTGAPSVLTIAPTGAARSASGSPTPLTPADVDAITHNVPDLVAVSRLVLGTAPVAAGNQSAPIRIEGVDPSYPQVTSATVAEGTLFGFQDASAANPVAILGPTVAGRLFPAVSPLGQTIRIRNVPFTVIGVLAAQGSAVADSPDDAILIPFQTGQVRLFGPNSLDAVLLRIQNASETAAVSLQVDQVLRQRHDVPSGQPDGFSIRANTSLAAAQSPLAALQLVGRVIEQYRQYVCEAKGICPSPQP